MFKGSGSQQDMSGAHARRRSAKYCALAMVGRAALSRLRAIAHIYRPVVGASLSASNIMHRLRARSHRRRFPDRPLDFGDLVRPLGTPLCLEHPLTRTFDTHKFTNFPVAVVCQPFRRRSGPS